ncbi:M16 family metallopeptidase [Pedobacter steynii]|uniref:Zinc protease n=1 Tax=Pedobacter steynii TaxID=430522 RepID=A0A1D7QBI2_9SPHI|nr:M16 family metallopeptidase [Pedobacter steynii]AOM75949.1 hypothetical protein BFS30_01435 [Pedobacter steynii]
MNKKTSYINLIILFTLVSTYYTAIAQSIPLEPRLRTGKLSNGLTYYLLHNDKPKGRADFYLVQKVGSVLEEENQRGLAHFLEHMAFNGTKHFPGKTLISELEKKGIRFGSNINASTGYDETIYRLTDIPINTQGIVDTALLVLYDWSGFIDNNDKDIDEERGIVREEWRTRSTGSIRVLENGIFPIIYAISPYANRIPIGTMEVVNNFKVQQLKEYYYKWYRPDLQAVIVVGDIDVQQIEIKLKKLFNTIPKHKNPSIRPEFNIPDNKTPIVAIATDPELADININVYWKLQNDPIGHKSTPDYYKIKMINKGIGNILMNRFSQLSSEAKSTYMGVNAIVDDFFVASGRQALSVSGMPRNKDSTAVALKGLLTEVERVKRFGFTEQELKIYKDNTLRLLEGEYNGRSKRENFEYVLKCIANFTKNEPFANADWEYQQGKELIASLKLQELNTMVQSLLGDTNMVITITGPQQQKVLPDKQGVLTIWETIKHLELQPYVAKSIRKIDPLPSIEVKGGKVVKTEQEPFGFVQWTLSNGAKVQFKKTDEKDGDLYIWGYSPGGLSVLNTSDLPSGLAMNSIINLGGLTDPERKASLTFKVDSYNETLGGKTSNLKNPEVFFKLLYLKMTRIEEQTEVFEKYIESKRNELSKLLSNPKTIYMDTLNSIMNDHHPRALISLNEVKTLDKVDYDKIIRIYKERFGNAADFTFFITGNVKIDSIKLMVEKYIGSLPTLNIQEKMIDHYASPPKRNFKKHFKTLMKIPQSTVTIGYTGKMVMNVENQMMMEYLRGVLKLVYTEKMREKEGSTYGVGVYADIYNFPVGNFIFQIVFDTDPSKKEKLLQIVYDEIHEIITHGPAIENLTKVKQNLLEIYKQDSSQQKNAYYWIDKAWMLNVYGLDGGLDYEKMVLSVTPKNVQKFAKHIFNPENAIEIIMDPE